jgi:hypothetical protein
VTTQSICQRCHRLRPVNGVRYCPSCAAELRSAEQRRRPASEPPSTDPPTAMQPEPADPIPVAQPLAQPIPAAAAVLPVSALPVFPGFDEEIQDG